MVRCDDMTHEKVDAVLDALEGLYPEAQAELVRRGLPRSRHRPQQPHQQERTRYVMQYCFHKPYRFSLQSYYYYGK